MKDLSKEVKASQVETRVVGEGESTTSEKIQVPTMEVKSIKGKNKLSKNDQNKIKIKE